MEVKALLIAYRKPGTTPAEFRTYYEEQHIPLIKSLSGNLFPIRHTRTYIARRDDASADYPAAVMMGTQDDFSYDALAEIVFRDEEHFQQFTALTVSEPFKGRLAADEENFIDRSKVKVVFLGDVCTTTATTTTGS